MDSRLTVVICVLNSRKDLEDVTIMICVLNSRKDLE